MSAWSFCVHCNHAASCHRGGPHFVCIHKGCHCVHPADANDFFDPGNQRGRELDDAAHPDGYDEAHVSTRSQWGYVILENEGFDAWAAYMASTTNDRAPVRDDFAWLNKEMGRLTGDAP